MFSDINIIRPQIADLKDASKNEINKITVLPTTKIFKSWDVGFENKIWIKTYKLMHMINLYILIHCCVYLFYSKLFYSLSIN